MKKVAHTDTVFLEGSPRKFVLSVCIYARSRFFWQGILRKIAKNASKNWTKISTYFKLRDGIEPRDFCGIKNPVILWFFGIKIGDLSRTNPEIPRFSSRKNPIQFSPVPGKVSFISLSIKPSQLSLEQSHSQNQGKNWRNSAFSYEGRKARVFKRYRLSSLDSRFGTWGVGVRLKYMPVGVGVRNP